MPEPTDADQAFALGLIHGLPLSLTGRVGLPEPAVRALTDRIAQALADERERARAPFLAVADRWTASAAADERAGLPALIHRGTAAWHIRAAAQEDPK